MYIKKLKELTRNQIMGVKHQQEGITLLETVIALTLVAFLTSVAVVCYIDQLPKARLNGATRQLLSDLMLARRQAVSRTQRVKLFFPDNQHYKICYDANGDGSVDDCEGNGTIKNIQTSYHGVTITPPTTPPTFLPLGTAEPLGATIEVKNASGSRALTIIRTGRIRMTSP